jgi:hypothetical protein
MGAQRYSGVVRRCVAALYPTKSLFDWRSSRDAGSDGQQWGEGRGRAQKPSNEPHAPRSFSLTNALLWKPRAPGRLHSSSSLLIACYLSRSRRSSTLFIR